MKKKYQEPSIEVIQLINNRSVLQMTSTEVGETPVGEGEPDD